MPFLLTERERDSMGKESEEGRVNLNSIKFPLSEGRVLVRWKKRRIFLNYRETDCQITVSVWEMTGLRTQ